MVFWRLLRELNGKCRETTNGQNSSERKEKYLKKIVSCAINFFSFLLSGEVHKFPYDIVLSEISIFLSYLLNAI